MSVAVTGTVIAAYLTVSGLLPLYNKALFQLFSFPVSATMLQLAAVSLMLFLRDRLVRLWCRGSQPPAIGASFGTKAKLLLLPAAFFGGNITLTNLGIHLTAVSVHVLLRASALPWVVILEMAACNAPCPPARICGSLAMLLTGVFLVGAGAGGEVGVAAVLITLLSAFCEAAHVVCIRRAVLQLTAVGTTEPAHGEVVGLLHRKESAAVPVPLVEILTQTAPPTPKVPELLMLKLALSMIFILPIAAMEVVHLVSSSSQTPWDALAAPSAFDLESGNFGRSCAVSALGIGVVTTTLFQGLMVTMATLMPAISIGFVAQCKVVPDYLATIIASGHMLVVCGCDALPSTCPSYRREDFNSGYFRLHLVGAFLVIVGALGYAIQRYKADSRRATTSWHVP